MDELVSLRRDLAESKILLDQHTKTINDLTYDKELLDKKKVELDGRLGGLEQEYEELLDKTIAEEEAAAQKNADMEDTISTLKVTQK
jgi:kinesin family protein 5